MFTSTYDVTFFDTLLQIVQDEPHLERDKAMYGLLASLGIERQAVQSVWNFAPGCGRCLTSSGSGEHFAIGGALLDEECA